MKVLCFGNSLTSGFPGYSPSIDGVSDGYGDPKSQYEYWLKNFCLDYLEKDLGSLDDYIIDNFQFINKGIPGELTRNLLNRIETDVLKFKPKPDYAIIIGGSNDLGWGISVEAIFSNIKELHTRARNCKIISIGATIPPIGQEQYNSKYHNKKELINTRLKTYFNERHIPFADLYKGMSNKKGRLARKYRYPDQLHFTVPGYRKMGEIIFNEALKNIIKSEYF
jgi:lysophospholipase L1-like esterase